MAQLSITLKLTLITCVKLVESQDKRGQPNSKKGC